MTQLDRMRVVVLRALSDRIRQSMYIVPRTSCYIETSIRACSEQKGSSFMLS